jgi:hypothetical protein
MDPISIQKLIETVGLPISVSIGLIYILGIIWKDNKEKEKKINDVQDARVQDSKEREDKLFVALQITTDELKAVRITMDKKHGKNEK